MDAFTQIRETAAAVQRATALVPRVGIVLGSGLGGFTETIRERTALSYRDLPHFPVSRVAGHAGELVLGIVQGVPCAVLSGRVHYYEGYDMQQVTFPMRVLAALGVTAVLVTNAAGALRPDLAPGSFMIITDHLNLTGANPLRGPNDERLGRRFPDLSDAYAERGRRALRGAAREIGSSLQEGVYAGVAGPSYETPAEVRMLRQLGADAVGMSTVAEVIVAVHAGLEVAGLSVITNYAAGLARTPLSHDEVEQTAARVQGPLGELLSRAVAHLATTPAASGTAGTTAGTGGTPGPVGTAGPA